MLITCLLQVQLMVDEYKVANLAVSKLCAQISDLLLVRVDGEIVYRDLEFQEDQKKHQHSQLLRLQAAHQDMVNILARVYMTFQTDGPEVSLSVTSQSLLYNATRFLDIVETGLLDKVCNTSKPNMLVCKLRHCFLDRV